MVISTSAMTPVRQFLSIIDARRSGRAASIVLMMSRTTSNAISGTLVDASTGMPFASTCFW